MLRFYATLMITQDVERQIQQGIEVLRRGGLVAFPTDTVYGLGASALIDSAVERVYEVKGRRRHLALPLLLADVADLSKAAREVPELAWKLAGRFLPGGLTLVLWKAAWVSKVISGGGETVAVRIPNHPVPLALIRGLGSPLTGTSANPSGKPSPLTAEEVRHYLGPSLGLIIDSGRCPGAIESTVVDLTGERPRLLREGAVPRRDLEAVCGTALEVVDRG
jgi:L-threonylcarbamoyladenylate synthase